MNPSQQPPASRPAPTDAAAASVLAVTQRGVYTVMTLQRPRQHNALNQPLLAALLAAFAALPPQTRVVLLRGQGPSFCAGACLTWLRQGLGAKRAQHRAEAALLAEVFWTIRHTPATVVAEVQGAVRGGGLGLVAAADIAVAEQNATFAFSELRLGLLPATIAPYVLERLGPARTRSLFLTAETFAAEAALRHGLVHEVVAPPALTARALEVATRCAEAGPAARAATKAWLNELAAAVTPAQRARSVEVLADIRAGAEAEAGLAAFFAKTSPAWAQVPALETKDGRP